MNNATLQSCEEDPAASGLTDVLRDQQGEAFTHL
jgi:hypothetical protein